MESRISKFLFILLCMVSFVISLKKTRLLVVDIAKLGTSACRG